MSDPLVIDASLLDAFQSCRRKFLLELDYRPLRWRPRSLFMACLRRAILKLSRGEDPVALADDACAWYMQTAANPGLDIQGLSPYVVAKDYCAMIQTILGALSRMSILALHEPEPVAVNGWTLWRPTAWADDSGALHRWLTVDSWGEDDLAREAHSWRTIGDMAQLKVPMTLHVIEIGQQRNGRRHSAWARAWKHPAMPALRYRFKRTKGREFEGWKPWWLAEHGEVEVGEWVDRMFEEGVAQELVREVNVRLPADEALDRVRGEIRREAIGMGQLATERASGPWTAQVMSRGACDGRVPCQFQNACYGEQVVELETGGLYVRRKSGRVMAAPEAPEEIKCS